MLLSLQMTACLYVGVNNGWGERKRSKYGQRNNKSDVENQGQPTKYGSHSH
jgi:hypothetical protein